ncbi:MAG: B-box zinc finger protein [Acidobacteria bacterium]|nr:B-box zinc finger protein [Acidobacteriota bacterium]MCI0720694.1 B-box zinc finger protein [Acidobacteriota bacterium]
MQCAKHPGAAATAYCSNCGMALCPECIAPLESRILCAPCEEEFRARQASAPPPVVPPLNPSAGKDFLVPPIPAPQGYPYCPPGVSLLLGFIPGVGSICNGDYFKAFLQVLVFGSLVSVASSHEAGDIGPVFGVLTAAVYLYMPFEAYHVAKKRTMAVQGIAVITPFEKMRFPELWVGSLAILAGSIFLANQFVPGTLHFVLRGWPLILIGIGVYNLTRHFRA